MALTMISCIVNEHDETIDVFCNRDSCHITYQMFYDDRLIRRGLRLLSHCIFDETDCCDFQGWYRRISPAANEEFQHLRDAVAIHVPATNCNIYLNADAPGGCFYLTRGTVQLRIRVDSTFRCMREFEWFQNLLGGLQTTVVLNSFTSQRYFALLEDAIYLSGEPSCLTNRISGNSVFA